MDDGRSAHLSEEQLAQFQDGELAAQEASHLEWCPECNGRLRDLRAASAAYVEYRESLRDVALPPIPKPWRSIAAFHQDRESGRPGWTRIWWQVAAVAAAVCLVVATVAILRRPASVQASELLTRSARAEVPSQRMISVRLRGRSLLRPAFLTMAGEGQRDAGLVHLEALFAQAHYSWRAPLSARSFQAWREQVRDKRDTVSVVGAAGAEQAFRVETDTGSGVLRSASLTLRGRDLRATDGVFRFEGEESVEMGEAAGPAPKMPPHLPPALQEPPAETPASAADTLRVLAALNAIGADVSDPIEISEDDRRQIVVSASGLGVERRQQVAAALQHLPHVRLDLDAGSGKAAPFKPGAGSPERYSTGMPGPMRQQFEERLGGSVALQEMTDGVLDAGGLAVSHAHAVEVLASKFPPPVEQSLAASDHDLLHSLRQRHVAELRNLAARIRTGLKPLLPAVSPAPSEDRRLGPWQSQAPELMTAAQRVDASLNSLLAGSYTQAAGEALLHGLAGQLERLEQAIQSQEGGR